MREQLVQYIDLLFAGSTGVEEIKEEILQNTLDRYDDLIAQGKTPDAAYRSAVSGIGDLDEILGSQPQPEPQEPVVDSVKYVPEETPGIPVSRVIRAFAVGLYIIAITPIILFDSLGLDNVGIIGTLLIAAAATFLLNLFPAKKGNAEEPAIPMPSDSVIRTIRAGAIGMYVFSIAPIILLDMIGLDSLGVCLMFAMIALATVLIMTYRKEKAAPVQEVRINPVPQNALKKSIGKLIDTIGLVLYFIISFSSGAWHITWLIFPITASVKGLVNACMDLKGEM